MQQQLNKETVKTIAKTIFYWENTYDLFLLNINGIYIWEIIRLEIFFLICRKLKILDFHQAKASPKEYFRYLPGTLFNSLFKNPLYNNKKCETLFFLHPRKVKVNNKYVDIYSNYIINEMNSSNIELFDKSFKGKHFVSGTNINLLDALETKTRINIKLKKNHIPEKNIYDIKKIEELINDRFNLRISLKSLFNNKLIAFQTKYAYYLKLLTKKQPKNIFLVVHYTNAALIAACKKLNIPVTEIQHGTTSPYHLGYNFPNNSDKLCYFPDYFFAFGEYWIKTINFPLKQECIKLIGFPHLSHSVKKYNNQIKKEKQVVFISQGAIGKKLFTIAVNFAKKHSNYNVIFKLHPGEKNKNYYNKIILKNRIYNISIAPKHTDLYSLLSESKYIVGIYSTALFEALLFNCNVFIAQIEGSEYVEPLVNNHFAQSFENANELAKKIKTSNKLNTNYSYLFYDYGRP
jgi:hypothetical protein